MPPRATLITRNDGFALSNISRPMRPIVSLFLGRCTVKKSASVMRRSISINSIFIARARSSETYGSKAIMRIPKAAARWATSFPIRPSPAIASVLSRSSTPSHLLRSHLPCTSAACAWGTFRATANNIAIVCSAADTIFDSGALATITPRFVAASTSTLSKPTPARPTTMRSDPASSKPSSTWVAERTINARAPLMATRNCSGVRSICTSTSCPA